MMTAHRRHKITLLHPQMLVFTKQKKKKSLPYYCWKK